MSSHFLCYLLLGHTGDRFYTYMQYEKSSFGALSSIIFRDFPLGNGLKSTACVGNSFFYLFFSFCIISLHRNRPYGDITCKKYFTL